MNSLDGLNSANLAARRPEDIYRENALQIIDNINAQFVRAVKEVNAQAFKNHGFGIFYTVNHVNRKGGIPLGEEFEEFKTYNVSISPGPEMDYCSPLRTQNNDLLFLGVFTPYFGPADELKKMAERGQIPAFEEVFNHWFTELSNELAFFQQNQSKIQETKEKVNRQFIHAIEEANKSIQANKWKPISINSANFPFVNIPLQEDKFEPLKKYRIWEIDNTPVTCAHFLRQVSIIDDRERFKEIVGNSNYNFDEIFHRCSQDIIEALERENRIANSCTLL